MAELSPMMKQYFEIKKDYGDTILMFRLGDFYEMFFDDAKTASKELDLVLTGRDCGQEERAPMCGVPFHSADGYIAKLVSKGYKVAVCEQLEDPKTAKGIVKRDVIRVITAGTVIESSMLDETKNNYLCSCCLLFDGLGLCFVDVSTGELYLTEFSENYDEKAVDELARFMPSEILMNKETSTLKRFCTFVSKKTEATAETLSSSEFDFEKCKNIVLSHFEKSSLDSLDLENKKSAVCALGAALSYLYNAQRNDLNNIKSINFYSDSRFMKIGLSTRRNLEITETMRDREKKGSLLWVLDKTKTAMGKRLIRNWTECPLYDCAAIIRRQNAVDELYGNTPLREELMSLMGGIYDMERLMTRVLYNTANAKELLSLKSTLSPLPRIKEMLSGCTSSMLKSVYDNIDLLEDVYNLVNDAISEDAPFSVREGGMIKDNFNAELDELRDIVNAFGGEKIDLSEVKGVFETAVAGVYLGDMLGGEKVDGVWYKGGEKWDFKADKVVSDITLVAKWAPEVYTVTFVTEAGDTPISQTVTYDPVNGKVVEPTIEKFVKTAAYEYEFVGWYFGDTKWNFDNIVAENMKLVARWNKNTAIGVLPND